MPIRSGHSALFAKQKPRRPGSLRPTLQPLSSSSKLSLSLSPLWPPTGPCPGPGPYSAQNALPPDSCQVNSVQMSSFKGVLPSLPTKNDPFLHATTPPTIISSSKLHRRISSSPFYKYFLNILISQPARADLLPSNILWWDPGQRIQVLTVSGFYSKMLTMTYVVTGCVCVCAKSLRWCLTLCNSMDCSPPASSVYGILKARILEWVAMPSSRGSSPVKNRTQVFYVSYISRQILYCWATREALYQDAKK